MSNEAKIRHNTGLSIFGVFEHMTRPSKILKIENRVEESGNTVGFKETVQLFE